MRQAGVHSKVSGTSPNHHTYSGMRAYQAPKPALLRSDLPTRLLSYHEVKSQLIGIVISIAKPGRRLPGVARRRPASPGERRDSLHYCTTVRQ